ncbi:MAG: ATP-binding cassette domain-containing protein [Acidimicrobiales bacterium]
MSPIGGVHVRSLSKSFGDRLAVDDVSFEARPGAVTALVGGNGSGKTTTLRMILGLTLPTSGSVMVAGRPIAELECPRSVIGAVTDRLGAHPGLRARRHLELIVAGAGLDPERVDRVAALAGLSGRLDDRVGGYSTGMRQRLAVAAALLGEPEVLVLDEPSSGLDSSGIIWLRELMTTRATEGQTVILTTHQFAEFDDVIDDVVVLHDGRVATAGKLADVLAASGARRLSDLVLGMSQDTAVWA